MRVLFVLILCLFSSLSQAHAKCEGKAILEGRLFVAQETQLSMRYIVAEASVLESQTPTVLNYIITMVDDSVAQVSLQRSDCQLISASLAEVF